MPAKDKVIIREVCAVDIEELTLLMADLGYPASVTDMQIRFKNINAHPDYKTIVATIKNEIVGMAGLYRGMFYERNGTYMRILAFVVKRSSRKQGIGRILIKACEAWAIEQGIRTIVLNSGNRAEREDAYAFYQKLGYAVKSSGFVKEL